MNAICLLGIYITLFFVICFFFFLWERKRRMRLLFFVMRNGYLKAFIINNKQIKVKKQKKQKQSQSRKTWKNKKKKLKKKNKMRVENPAFGFFWVFIVWKRAEIEDKGVEWIYSMECNYWVHCLGHASVLVYTYIVINWYTAHSCWAL